jgi:hypothetical protein
MSEIKTATWTTQSGKLVAVTGKLITESTNYADGYNIVTSCCKILIDVNVQGYGSQGNVVRKVSGLPSGYTHKVGNLALTSDQAQIIANIIAELETTPEWQAKQAKIARNQAEIASITPLNMDYQD